MKRISCMERPHWRDYAHSVGFDFHTFDGEPYWDETAYYQFSLRQIEHDLEEPTETLHQMVMDMVGDIVRSESMLTQLSIPRSFWDHIAHSWRKGDPHLYGRMDFAYNGKEPAKLLELNYDTPTSLFEAGFFQWMWLEDQIKRGVLPADADQFNSIQDKLEQAFRQLSLPQPFYFSSVQASIEDKGTVLYLMDIASQTGMDVRYIPIEQIGAFYKPNGDAQFVDQDSQPIHGLFKLYPWEFMVHEEFAPVIRQSNTQMLEPAWKMLLSNKGILPLLWQRYPEHPNLLPAFFDEEPSQSIAPGWVRKPLFSREGANVEMVTLQGVRLYEAGPYSDQGYILQKLQPLPRFYDEARRASTYTLLGSWVVGDYAAGIGIREDATLITKDTSRFVPHIILD